MSKRRAKTQEMRDKMHLEDFEKDMAKLAPKQSLWDLYAKTAYISPQTADTINIGSHIFVYLLALPFILFIKVAQLFGFYKYDVEGQPIKKTKSAGK